MKRFAIAYLISTLSSIVYAQQVRHQDCSQSYEICALKTYHFADVTGFGATKEKSSNNKCFPSGFEESNAHWISWEVEKDGIITFVINPNNDQDDVDFILYKKDGSSCNGLKEVRCMATGNNIGEDASSQRNCQGPTGLTANALDEFESSGCKFDSDNFLKMLKVEKGESYALLVNNYDSGRGYSITLEGDATLRAKAACDDDQNLSDLDIVQMYPNPADDRLNIVFTQKLMTAMEISLVDITGKELSKISLIPNDGHNHYVADVSDLVPGTYLVRLKQGDKAVVKPILKK